MTEPPPARRVTVFGGSGFLGRAIATRLAAEGWQVRVAVRRPARVESNDRIEACYADVRDETSVAQAVKGAQAVVNAVGLYVEKGAETFTAVHELGAVNVAHQTALQRAERLVLISGIGADPRSPSAYVRARAIGELLTRDVFAGATVLRPSAIFAPDDRFLNSLAEIARRTPLLPLFGRGATKLQPVYAGDVAAAVAAALTHPVAPGQTYELGGPTIYSYRDLIDLLLAHTGRRCWLLPLPFFLWDVLAALSALLPSPPITRAQVTLMKQDNVVADNALTLADLSITATALEEVLRLYRFA